VRHDCSRREEARELETVRTCAPRESHEAACSLRDNSEHSRNVGVRNFAVNATDTRRPLPPHRVTVPAAAAAATAAGASLLSLSLSLSLCCGHPRRVGGAICIFIKHRGGRTVGATRFALRARLQHPLHSRERSRASLPPPPSPRWRWLRASLAGRGGGGEGRREVVRRAVRTRGPKNRRVCR